MDMDIHRTTKKHTHTQEEELDAMGGQRGPPSVELTRPTRKVQLNDGGSRPPSTELHKSRNTHYKYKYKECSGDILNRSNIYRTEMPP
jgi:hypothetical protein